MRHDCSPECDVSKRSVSRENVGVLRESRVTDDDFGTVEWPAATYRIAWITHKSTFAAICAMAGDA
jgi:hypothetical protein